MVFGDSRDLPKGRTNILRVVVKEAYERLFYYFEIIPIERVYFFNSDTYCLIQYLV